MFYWPRLWVLIDKDYREEVDNAQSVVDSTVYISFAFYLSGVTMLVYACINAVQRVPFRPSWLSYSVQLPYVPAAQRSRGVKSRLHHRRLHGLPPIVAAHATFGELFKSVFDMHRSKLDIEDVVASVGRLVGDHQLVWSRRKEKNAIALAVVALAPG